MLAALTGGIKLQTLNYDTDQLKDMERQSSKEDRIVDSENDTPVKEVPRTNTGVKIDNPEEMEEAGK